MKFYLTLAAMALVSGMKMKQQSSDEFDDRADNDGDLEYL